MKEIFSAIVLFTTHLLEAITGFGSTVLALPFLNVTLGLRLSVQLLCCLSWFLSFYIVLRSWKSIPPKELLFIVCWVGLGVPIGIWIFDRLPAVQLCLLLGVFMVLAGVRGEPTVLRKSAPESGVPARRSILLKLVLLAGGIIQGAFGSGGPFVVIYSAKALPDKHAFRVTLSTLWLTMNSIRLVYWGIRGELWNAELGRCLVWGFPVVIAGIFLGDFLHRRVSEYHFKLGVYAILTISGVFMVLSNAMKL